MSVFEIITSELLDEIAELESQAAFTMIARRALAYVSRALGKVDDNEQASWAIYEDAQHTAMNAIIAAAKRLDVTPFDEMQVPRRREFGSRDFVDFQADLDHYLTQILLDSGLRDRRDAVVIPPKVKDRLRGPVWHAYSDRPSRPYRSQARVTVEEANRI
jgi:hypothetical protein